MKPIAAEALIRRLIAWGVDTIYGLPGDGINGLFEGLRRHQDEIEFVLVHHEEAAAFIPNLRHVELFADHERLEQLLFDGVPTACGGTLTPTELPGNGFRLSSRAAEFAT